jgi:hypothetical protein
MSKGQKADEKKPYQSLACPIPPQNPFKFLQALKISQ